MDCTNKNEKLRRLRAALIEWSSCPSYERSNVVEWLQATGALVERCDNADLPGSRLPWAAAALLLREVALASYEVELRLDSHIKSTSCSACEDEVALDEDLCHVCKRLGF